MPRPAGRSGCERASAALTLLLGLSLLATCPALAATAEYLGVLAAVGSGIAFLAGLRLWFSGCLVAWTLALSVACATAGAQLLGRGVGLPGRIGLDPASDLLLLGALAVTGILPALKVLDTRGQIGHPSGDAPFVIERSA